MSHITKTNEDFPFQFRRFSSVGMSEGLNLSFIHCLSIILIGVGTSEVSEEHEKEEQP